MATRDDRGVESKTVECAVCMKQIPASVAVSPEGDEYVFYFCGPECHAEWEREQAATVEAAFYAHSGVKRP